VDFFMKWIPSTRKAKNKSAEVVAPAAAPSLAQAPKPAATDKSLPAAPSQSETISMETVPPPPISKTAEEPLPEEAAADMGLPVAPMQ
jgi:hypothetical protein